jgi:hypothetical protein
MPRRCRRRRPHQNDPRPQNKETGIGQEENRNVRRESVQGILATKNAVVQLYIEGKADNSTGTTKVQQVMPDAVHKAQQIIAEARGKGEATENEAITNAISILYPYGSRSV